MITTIRYHDFSAAHRCNQDDPFIAALFEAVRRADRDTAKEIDDVMQASYVGVPFNPTTENLANHLLRAVAPRELAGTGIEVVRVDLQETRKCGATALLTEPEMGVMVGGAVMHETVVIPTLSGKKEINIGNQNND